MNKVTRKQLTLGARRKDRPKKRSRSFNGQNTETDDSSFPSTSAKKLKGDDREHVPEDYTLQYSIIDFALVFSTLSSFVRCSNIIKNEDEDQLCNVKVQFKQWLAGCKKFCGLMDISSSFLNQSTYDFYIGKIYECIDTVTQTLFSSAAQEEKKFTSLENDLQDTTDVSVSGDGTWKKRGFSSLYGVSSLIGCCSGKVLDVLVKSSYCKLCESWKNKLDTAEYEEWKDEHIKTNQCTANHTGASGNMEVSLVIEMFKRSIVKHGLRFVNYIGDGDSKTYSGLLKAQPYGEDFVINKKECVGHVQKRMGTRLRELVKKTTEEKIVKGPDSWCAWQRASATNTLSSFKHDYTPLPDEVLIAMKPVYENLSKDELLGRCVGGFTQNNNESFNQLIWKITPKILPADSKIVNIAALVAACIFNEGTSALLLIMHGMDLKLGRNSHEYARISDENRVCAAEKKSASETREARIRHRQEQKDALDIATAAGSLLNGPGIDDSL
ncbi:unnamed protein product [Pieris brassicae]|uniref:Mutator-like transposase domain-containing protein n=1 Tax=Pieris brassicae TaxID=7116 RepID=A0A9P0X6M0_PIEBR|nr:unnamed protein product [Pieris brassicae]